MVNFEKKLLYHDIISISLYLKNDSVFCQTINNVHSQARFVH